MPCKCELGHFPDAIETTVGNENLRTVLLSLRKERRTCRGDANAHRPKSIKDLFFLFVWIIYFYMIFSIHDVDIIPPQGQKYYGT